MKLCVVVAAISSFAIVRCRCGDAVGRKLDGVQYKNHRTTTSTRNDTRDKTYPVYASQVYADLSNVRDFAAAVGEQPTDTPSSLQDVVRIYITPAPTTAKRKPDPPQPATTVTAQTPAPNVTPAAHRTSTTVAAHPMVFVTAVQPPYHGKELQRKSVPSSSASQQHFLYATTQSPPSSSQPPQQQSVVVGSSNKAQSPGNASKPFATVLVPKQMLDGGGDSTAGYNGARRDDPFRPIAAPSFSYRPTMTAVDANSVTQQQEPNRRMSSSSAVVVRSRPSVAYKVQEDHASAAYKVLEEHPSDRTTNGVRQPSPRDRADHHAQRAKLVQQQQQENGVRRYATFATEPIVVRYEKTPASAVDQQPREYYPATRAPPSAFHSYGPSGKPYEWDKPTGSQPTNGAKEPSSSSSSDGGPPTIAWPFNPPAALSESAAGPEFAVDDVVNAKDVLKSLLRDMLKSRQRKPPSTDEVVESYYSNNRGNVGQDFGLDDYDIDTGESDNNPRDVCGR